MTKLLLSLHVLAAILAVGSITVAASMFPRHALRALDGGEREGGQDEGQGTGVAALLHRICRGYAVAGVTVPVFGVATGAALGVLTDAWLIASLVLTAAAAALLALAILPGQRRLLALAGHAPDPAAARPMAARLTMLTGVFNVLWAIVVVLMIVRPGSTTGA
ncbi:hypothetical protein [Streptomyces radicis]|uniref:DUF2269 family protein n=1 Tax=Streptomyces radicis TaxID=1750517 RepID=A0A3A9WJF4_9ACTN|nr:hypothetical protein [Streptomyces radicis]RKN12463.1 hypothetical protein D7319_00390 [Streptomyces radicis]RKN27769.1 hypothetical protein D7318_02500 [Streptomyces radicis]